MNLKLNAEVMLITDFYSLRYYTKFTGSNALAFVTKSEKIFFTDFRYMEQAKSQLEKTGFEIIEVKTGDLIDGLKKYFGKKKIKTVSVENKTMTISYFNKIKKIFKNSEFIMSDDYLEKERMIKKADEIEKIKKAAKISDMAFSEILKDIKVGVKEKDIAAKLEYIMKMNGAEKESFETIVASGYRSAMPHGVASDKKIGNNEFVKMDFGAYYKGYVSDMTRTVYIGENISEKHLEIYNIVLEAQLKSIEAVKEGVKASDLDKVARDYIKSKGYGENFGHGLGHGIGLYIHEGPRVSSKSDVVLKEGMVITIEPGIYIEGFGGVRIEDDVLVKKDSCEILTKSKKDLIIL